MSFLQEVDSVSSAAWLYFCVFCLCDYNIIRHAEFLMGQHIVYWLSKIGICSLDGWISVKYNGKLWNCFLFSEAHLHYYEMSFWNSGKHECISRYEVMPDCYLKSVHDIRRGVFLSVIGFLVVISAAAPI